MYIFLDESGGLGFNFDRKSPSYYFVITLLVCRDRKSYLAIKSSIKHTLKKVNHKRRRPVSELKSTSTDLKVKKYFYRNITKKSNDGWEVYTITLDKHKALFSMGEKIDAHRIYNVLTNKLLNEINYPEDISTLDLIVDSCKSPKERNVFNTYLYANLGTILPLNVNVSITHELSHNSFGLQAVDLFCHGISRKYTAGDSSWHDIFKGKISKEEIYI